MDLTPLACGCEGRRAREDWRSCTEVTLNELWSHLQALQLMIVGPEDMTSRTTSGSRELRGIEQVRWALIIYI